MDIPLKVIHDNVNTCTKCPLCETRIHAVPGRGNVYAKIMIVGEAPGQTEDKIGKPFVGRAGKILDDVINNSGLTELVYITNIVKCRPPKNRVPLAEEQTACNTHLDAEMKLINPQIICLLGNTAYNSLLGGTDITKNRGKVQIFNNQKYFPTFHPAAVIYNQKLRPLLQKDFETIAGLIV